MSTNTDVMLTTKDNPYDPFTQFDEWNDFDEAKGYYTNAYLARIANVSDSLSPIEIANELNNAIDEILSINGHDLYVKLSKDT